MPTGQPPAPVRVQIITYVPTQFQHCQHCEVTWQVIGLGRKVHREQIESGLPDGLARQFHDLSEWARTVSERFGPNVTIRLVDVASIEGFFKSLIHRLGRYPAFVVDRQRYVGSDFSLVDSLIAERLGTRERTP